MAGDVGTLRFLAGSQALELLDALDTQAQQAPSLLRGEPARPHTAQVGQHVFQQILLELRRLVQVDEGLRQRGQRPIEIGRTRRLDQILQLRYEGLSDGRGHERLNQRRGIAEMSAKGEAGLQRVKGVVVLPLGHL